MTELLTISTAEFPNAWTVRLEAVQYAKTDAIRLLSIVIGTVSPVQSCYIFFFGKIRNILMRNLIMRVGDSGETIWTQISKLFFGNGRTCMFFVIRPGAH